MSNVYSDYLDKARRYLHSADTVAMEGDYDSAISRIYYAMFFCATVLLYSKGHRYTSHKGVITHFAQYFVKTGEMPTETSTWLQKAFRARQKGDYDARSALDDSDVEEHRAQADLFVRLTEEYLQKHDFLTA